MKTEKTIIDRIFIFESTASPKHFKKIFDENSDSYYQLFARKCNKHVARFKQYLNSKDSEKLEQYFN